MPQTRRSSVTDERKPIRHPGRRAAAGDCAGPGQGATRLPRSRRAGSLCRGDDPGRPGPRFASDDRGRRRGDDQSLPIAEGHGRLSERRTASDIAGDSLALRGALRLALRGTTVRADVIEALARAEATVPSEILRRAWTHEVDTQGHWTTEDEMQRRDEADAAAMERKRRHGVEYRARIRAERARVAARSTAVSVAVDDLPGCTPASHPQAPGPDLGAKAGA